ncbi:MAG TPA: HDOD domain-containing protein [Spirochaetota bacterium]|nr:HDOD domain-containing protein [Spirochaetota bacterium]HOL57107.1 HDOD domain-containing protein [Spirochaetota bacterium]HPP04280.1 HDOD domain-containing protein [Spirochaetota bacterium]
MGFQKLSEKEIKYYINNNKPVVFKDYKIPEENEDYYVEVLKYFLKHLGKEKIGDYLGYCLREIINNAKKANTKRVFFLDQKLDINNIEHYNKGMKIFKEKTLANLDYYLDLQEKYNYFVQVYYHITDKYLNIIITNNAPILEIEKERINQKVQKAKIFNSIDEAMQLVFDDSEGAGFGIVIIILMLRKIGISDKNFGLATEREFTHVRIAVPVNLITQEETDIISDALIKEIDSIPQFPEHILTLNKMLMHKEVDLKEVSQIIKKDPALTMDLLKMANSAHYRRTNKIEKIEIAVGIVGVKGLKYLIESSGVKRSLEKKYDNTELQKLWDHSSEIAQISSILCDKFKLNELGDLAYIGGLLHDIGKIVLKYLHPQAAEKIQAICKEKGIGTEILEHLLEGTNHALIGAKMAEKWEIPENIVKVIRNHHNPLGAEDEVKEVCKIIYLAHVMHKHIHSEDEILDFEKEILEAYNISTEEKLVELKIYIRNVLTSKNSF